MTDLEQQLLLRSTAKEFFASDFVQSDIADMGWLGLLTDQRAGGEGWYAFEAALICLEGGWAGTSSTWYASALAAGFISNAPGLENVTTAVLAGDQVGAIAYSPSLTLTDSKVSGTVVRVLSQSPPSLVVLTRHPGVSLIAEIGSNGTGLFGDVESLETERQIYSLAVDQTPVVSVEGPIGDALELLALVLLCADTVGAVGRAVRIVTDHLVQREAFEVPIASFQVIQHRLVNLDIFHRTSEALVLTAAAALAEHDPRSEQRALAAHSFIEGRAVKAIDDCIQLAGGIGFTWEFPIHHALRRVSTNSSLLGPGRASRHRLAKAKCWTK